MSASPNDADESGGDRVNEVTQAEEEHEAQADHTSDRWPTSDDEAAAERTEPDPSVASTNARWTTSGLK
jgi:hypothetical protein